MFHRKKSITFFSKNDGIRKSSKLLNLGGCGPYVQAYTKGSSIKNHKPFLNGKEQFYEQRNEH